MLILDNHLQKFFYILIYRIREGITLNSNYNTNKPLILRTLEKDQQR